MFHESPNGFPDDPVLLRCWRGDRVESVHRGAWVVTDAAGTAIEGRGGFDYPFFARSSIKSLQAMPLLETGAAARFGFGEAELALALASHSAEPRHTDVVLGMLARTGLGPEHLQCGPQMPRDNDTRMRFEREGITPTGLHNNCSGKHAGFLALARHLGVAPEAYLDPRSEGQVLVREALAQMCDLEPAELVPYVDGCSAPTYRLPLRGLATAFARIANPEGLAAERREHCRRMTAAVARHPFLIAGSAKRLCSELAHVSGGRLFPKVGAEAVYAIGLCGGDRGLALKVDDGGPRGVHAVVLALLERLGWLEPDELAPLAEWSERTLRNYAGLEVGRLEPLVGG